MSDSIFKVIFLVGFVVGFIIRGVFVFWIQFNRRSKQNIIIVDRKTGLDKLLLFYSSMGFIVIPLFYLLSPRLDFADYHLPTWAGWAAGLVGTAVFAMALLLLWRSHADLGRNWLPTLQIREEQSLVTKGVFHYIRHPMYTAHLLWGIAQALLLQNWIAGFAMLVTILPLYLVRIPREEKMMLEHFGEEYRLYMNRTGRVIPLLWR